MKSTINYQQLSFLSSSIGRVNADPGLGFLLKSKINHFYSRNAMRLNVIDSTMQKLVKKYVQHVDDKPVTKKDEKGNEVYVFENELAEKEYLQETEKFMQLTFEIELP